MAKERRAHGRGPGDTPLSMSQEPGAGRPRKEELARLVVAIERLGDALERHGNILCEWLQETAVTDKVPKSSLRQPLGEQILDAPVWQSIFATIPNPSLAELTLDNASRHISLVQILSGRHQLRNKTSTQGELVRDSSYALWWQQVQSTNRENNQSKACRPL